MRALDDGIVEVKQHVGNGKERAPWRRRRLI
jgi:hypothetical protein